MALITAQEVKTNTSMGGNVDPDNFIHLIDDIQVTVLENVLGTKLYNDIVSKFEADTLANEYLTLFTNYIKPVLWFSVYAEYLRDGVVLAMNGGIFTHTPDGATPADLENIKWSAKNAMSKADVYIDRMVKYLCDKTSEIPEYSDVQDNNFDQKPGDISTLTGWWFGSTPSDRRGRSTGSGGDFIELE